MRHWWYALAGLAMLDTGLTLIVFDLGGTEANWMVAPWVTATRLWVRSAVIAGVALAARDIRGEILDWSLRIAVAWYAFGQIVNLWSVVQLWG